MNHNSGRGGAGPWVLDALDSTQDKLGGPHVRGRLANRQGEHVYCIGSTEGWVERSATEGPSTNFFAPDVAEAVG